MGPSPALSPRLTPPSPTPLPESSPTPTPTMRSPTPCPLLMFQSSPTLLDAPMMPEPSFPAPMEVAKPPLTLRRRPLLFEDKPAVVVGRVVPAFGCINNAGALVPCAHPFRRVVPVVVEARPAVVEEEPAVAVEMAYYAHSRK